MDFPILTSIYQCSTSEISQGTIFFHHVIYIYIYIYIYIHTHIFTVCVCVNIYIYIYIYTYSHGQNFGTPDKYDQRRL